MSLNVYCGLQGSGKSYEVVSSVILNAISNGRTVVTNVDGIDAEKICEYLQKKYPKSDPTKYGNIIHINNEVIKKPHFFYDSEAPELETVVQRGDIVCIDEAWRFWGTDCGKVSPEHMQYFRMHRHYIHPETNLASDIVLMTQDISGLHRSVKNVVEFAFKMKKFKAFGSSSRYRVDLYEGSKFTLKTRISYFIKKYDKAIFPLYQSYSGGVGVETSIDKRQNILASKTLWLYIASLLVISCIAFTFVWKFFHPKPVHPSSQSTATTTQAISTNVQPAQNPPIPNFSRVWRITGFVSTLTGDWVVLSDANGNFRLESPSLFYGAGLSQIGTIDGEKVTHWSGDFSSSQSNSESAK